MRIHLGVLVFAFGSAAAAEPLTFSDLGAATTRTAMAGQLGNCEASPTVPGQVVCVLHRSDLGGVPLGTSLAHFQGDYLQAITLVAAGRFRDVSGLLQQRYGPAARANSNRVRQTDGRMATLRNTEWNFDDGGIQLATAEIAGDPRSAIIRFTWRRVNF